MSIAFWSRRLKRKVLSHWKDASSSLRIQRIEDEAKTKHILRRRARRWLLRWVQLHRAVAIGRGVRARRVLLLWSSAAAEAAQLRSAELAAVRVWAARTLRRGIVEWRQGIRRQRARLMSCAMQIHRMRKKVSWEGWKRAI